MPRNFDDLLPEDHTIIVRGQTFTWREVRPEVLSAMGQALSAVNDDDPEAGWSSIDDQILQFLVPEDHERWKALRAQADAPVTIKQINAILDYLVGEQSDRPTTTPSPSVSGPGKTVRSSKAA